MRHINKVEIAEARSSDNEARNVPRGEDRSGCHPPSNGKIDKLIYKMVQIGAI